MGKKDKKKEKKIKGAVKTAAKTEKNALKRMKKELTKDEDLDAIIASVQEEERKRNLVVENLCDPISIRSGISLCSNTEKDELIFFGGEYFNGSKTVMYNDLYIYNIKKNKWLQVSSPNGPLPRCAHQAVFVPQMGGQLWIFGGEFSSPTHSQFRHYSDLWVFHFADKKWELVKGSGGPSSRSGHRMVLSQKKLIVFGGFHESLRDYKYFNDVYAFDLETRKWSKIDARGSLPCPRSGCQMAALPEGGVLVYGGYSREKVKKDLDKGTVHTDMYLLQPDKKKAEAATNEPTKWKWVSVKQSGSCPSPRCGFSMTTIPPGNRAALFGGVFDVEESEESIQGKFYNDLYLLDLETWKWTSVQLKGANQLAGEAKTKRRRKVKDESMEDGASDNEEGDPILEPNVENLSIEDSEQVVADDGIFVVKMGPQSSNDNMEDLSENDGARSSNSVKAFVPHSRMNASLVTKNGVLYLFGGTFEDGDRQLTLADFYALDLKKLDEWKTLVAMDVKTQEWLESDSSDDSAGEESESDDDDEDNDNDEEMDCASSDKDQV